MTRNNGKAIVFMSAILCVLAFTITRSDAKPVAQSDFFREGATGRAFGMGNAYVGLADDIGAIYWNPAGLAMTFHHLPMQWASVAGIYGLSFWVILVNLLALKILLLPKRSVRSLVPFFCCAIFPYLFQSTCFQWSKSLFLGVKRYKSKEPVVLLFPFYRFSGFRPE